MSRIVTLYKLRGFKNQNVRMVGPKGRMFLFIQGRCWPQNEEEAAELEELRKNSGGKVYIDDKNSTVDLDAIDPLDVIKQRAIQEFLEKHKANLSLGDLGNYAQGKLDASGSNKLPSAAPGQDVVAKAVSLGALQTKLSEKDKK